MHKANTYFIRGLIGTDGKQLYKNLPSLSLNRNTSLFVIQMTHIVSGDGPSFTGDVFNSSQKFQDVTNTIYNP